MPKKIIDITKKNSQDSDIVDVLGETKKTLQILGEVRRETQDLQKQKAKKKLNLSTPTNIELEKKYNHTQSFDALERCGPIIFFFRGKIDLRKKTSILKKIYIFFGVCGVFTQRKIKNKYYAGKKFFLSLSFWGYMSLIIIVFSTLGLYVFGAKIIIEHRVNRGYETLLSIQKNGGSIEEIQKGVNDARFDFLLADILFFPFSFFEQEHIQSVYHTIKGGKYISRVLDTSLQLYWQTDAFIQKKSLSNIYWTNVAQGLHGVVTKLKTDLSQSLYHYESITWLPSEELLQDKERLADILKKGQKQISYLDEHYDTLLSILGSDERKQYLIVFQNADEIRPMGGFMGSMALVGIHQGKVDVFQKKDVYAIEWDLKLVDYEKKPAPKGINELTEYFGLRDANYFINTKDSAESIAFFVQQAGLEVDGIIFLNQNTIAKLLSITGPVYFDLLKRDISENNFSEALSLAVESKMFKFGTLGTPKQVVFDFIQVFKQELLQQGKYLDYIGFFLEEIEKREIMFWVFDEEAQEFLSQFQADGNIDFSQSLDFGYPVYTSVSGNKSDRYMRRSYRQNVALQNDCSFFVETQLSATHAMTKAHQNSIETLMREYELDPNPELEYIQGKGRNRQFVRYLLPHNARDIRFESGELVDYGSRKGLEFFLETPLLQSSQYSFSYFLDNPDCQAYSYTFYKQAGKRPYDIDIIYNDTIESFRGLDRDFYFKK